MKGYARLFGTTTIAKNIAESNEWRKFVALLDERAPQTSRKSIENEIANLWLDTRAKIARIQKRAKSIAIAIGKSCFGRCYLLVKVFISSARPLATQLGILNRWGTEGQAT